MSLLDDASGANVELEALRSAGWQDRGIASLSRVRERNNRRSLEWTPEASKLDWLRWMVATHRLDPREPVTPLPKEMHHDRY